MLTALRNNVMEASDSSGILCGQTRSLRSPARPLFKKRIVSYTADRSWHEFPLVMNGCLTRLPTWNKAGLLLAREESRYEWRVFTITAGEFRLRKST